MHYQLTLLTKAKEVCGGWAQLCRELGVSPSNMSAVKEGKRAVPEDWVPGLAVLVGVDVTEALHEYRSEKFGPNAPAVRVLEKKAAAGVVAMLLFFFVLGLMPQSGAIAGEVEKPRKSLIFYTS